MAGLIPPLTEVIKIPHTTIIFRYVLWELHVLHLWHKRNYSWRRDSMDDNSPFATLL